MTAERTLPQDSHLGSTQSTQNAALRGASLAFEKPPVKPKPKSNTYSGINGALAAATKVQSRQASRSRVEDSAEEQRLAHQNTGSSTRSFSGGSYGVSAAERGVSQRQTIQLGGDGYLQLPRPAGSQSRSPSHIAATLAASRSASISPNPTGTSSLSIDLRSPNGVSARSPSVKSVGSSRGSSDPALDTSSIRPTTSLIGMFEQNAAPRSTTKVQASRTSTIPPSAKQPGPKPSPLPLSPKAREPLPRLEESRNPDIKAPKPLPAKLASPPTQSSPPATAQKPSVPKAKPVSIPEKQPTPEVPNDDDDTSSDDSFVSASEYKPSFRDAVVKRNRLASNPNLSVHSQQIIDDMANAIVASSLASSRAASPSKNALYPPTPPPRRNGRNHFFHNTKDNSRTPSPSKPVAMRTTMRKLKPEEEVDEGEKRRAKKKFVKKHPNKHHEGDRKRWRDTVTERERKRYEAVWASNKGLFNDGEPGGENSVLNLVARDIFSRSRLNDDVLEEVYELVDRTGSGRLEKEEFVVGLWLIDQRLKGRKLPIRVTESVWYSVGGLGGIKVRKMKH